MRVLRKEQDEALAYRACAAQYTYISDQRISKTIAGSIGRKVRRSEVCLVNYLPTFLEGKLGAIV